MAKAKQNSGAGKSRGRAAAAISAADDAATAGAARVDAADILVAGGGLVGLTFALAAKQAAPTLDVVVVDAGRPGGTDFRASAVADSGRRMLERLGVWPTVAADAQPILEMVITDSRLHDATRPVFLTFDGATEAGAPFAHMVLNAPLLAALTAAARAAGVTMLAERVADYAADGAGVAVTLGSGDTLTARLLVAADGARSRLRGLAGIRTLEWKYPQTGIVATVAHEKPHHGRAEEHFLPAGPFAILPLTQNRASLVWTERTELAERLVAGDDFTFLMELERRFGQKLGKLTLLPGRASHPLGLMLARDFVRPRFALLGDAAHAIHPIAGQGLNLGLRDAAALAECVVEAVRIGEDAGSAAALARYQRWRRFDTLQMAAVTDGLNRLFASDFAPLRMIRDFGLGLVDRLPPLKRFFIGEAAGDDGRAPRLMLGEGI